MTSATPAFWGAVILTVATVVFVLCLALGEHCEMIAVGQEVCMVRYRSFLRLSPNEMGDTIAGIAGALALIWVAASVVIQRSELSATVFELKKTNKLSSERAALREYDLVLDDLLDAVACLDTATSMYGGWRFRKGEGEPIESADLLTRSDWKKDGREQWLPTIQKRIEHLQKFFDDPLWIRYKFPQRGPEYRKLLVCLGRVDELVDALPRLEQRLVREWRLPEAARSFQEIWDDDRYWDKEVATS
ncbi:hypothetical protein [Actibacterium lipolyticum]|nr:hypothetical protein [Actibacterium lipolyticum]